MCKEVHVYLAAVSTSGLDTCRTTKYLYVRTAIISYERPDINVSAARSAINLSRFSRLEASAKREVATVDSMRMKEATTILLAQRLTSPESAYTKVSLHQPSH